MKINVNRRLIYGLIVCKDNKKPEFFCEKPKNSGYTSIPLYLYQLIHVASRTSANSSFSCEDA